MTGVYVSAPGKVILHGEHAVVYGKTAIAASVGLRTEMFIKTESEHVILLLPDLNKSYSWTTMELESLAKHIPRQSSPGPAQTEVLKRIQEFLSSSENQPSDNGVIAFIYLYLSILPQCPPMTARITSDIPIGAGLGSSAAMSVCFASGLLLFGRNHTSYRITNGGNTTDHNENVPKYSAEYGGSLAQERLEPELDIPAEDKELICSWALMSEKIMHGTPSGIDNSVATYGGVINFCSGVMTPQLSLEGLNVLLTNTGVGRNTRLLVAAVRERYDIFPEVMEPIMEATDKLSLAVLHTLKTCREKQFSGCEEEFRILENMVDMNQGLLSSMGVSHPSLEKVIQLTSSHGLHTKLTGAGGGGVAFSLITPHTDKSKVEQAKQDLELEGLKCYTATMGGPGVRAWSLA